MAVGCREVPRALRRWGRGGKLANRPINSRVEVGEKGKARESGGCVHALSSLGTSSEFGAGGGPLNQKPRLQHPNNDFV